MRQALDLLVKASVREIREQGHVASGRGVRSLETRVRRHGGLVIGEVLVNDYMMFVDSGTRPHFPPVRAILKWVKTIRPGLSEASAKSMAWAVATNMAKEGTPSRGSFQYSKNGRRREWTRFAAEASARGIDAILEDSDWLQFVIDEVIRKALRA